MASTERRSFFPDAVAGVRLLAGDRLLRALGAGQPLAALSAGAASALLVVLAGERRAGPWDRPGVCAGGW